MGVNSGFKGLRHKGGVKVGLHSKSSDREKPVTFRRPEEETAGGGPLR